jgi:hypothetical protein
MADRVSGRHAGTGDDKLYFRSTEMIVLRIVRNCRRET